MHSATERLLLIENQGDRRLGFSLDGGAQKEPRVRPGVVNMVHFRWVGIQSR